MTATQVLLEAAQRGIILEAKGDRLQVEAPAGRVTPALREAIAEHKPTLLALLSPDAPRLVILRGGLAVPVAALLLALDLEARGFRLTVDGDHHAHIAPADQLTDADRRAMDRWRHHLGAIVEYHCDTA